MPEHHVRLHLRPGDEASVQRDGQELARLQYEGRSKGRGDRVSLVFQAPMGTMVRAIARPAKGEPEDGAP